MICFAEISLHSPERAQQLFVEHWGLYVRQFTFFTFLIVMSSHKRSL
jgi:hypothetical protein